MLIDVTPTHYSGGRSGVQRVVREIAKAAVESGDGLPVFIEDGRLLSHFRHPSLPDAVAVAEGDKFLMLDVCWNHIEAYRPIMERVSQKNGSNVVCLYDLIPLVFPKAFAPGSVRAFEIWFEKIVLPADAVVGISKSVAEEFYACVQGREIGGACPSAGFTWARTSTRRRTNRRPPEPRR